MNRRRIALVCNPRSFVNWVSSTRYLLITNNHTYVCTYRKAFCCSSREFTGKKSTEINMSCYFLKQQQADKGPALGLAYLMPKPICIRKVLRPANSIKAFRGFTRSQSKCWVGTQIPRRTACFLCSPPNGDIKISSSCIPLQCLQPYCFRVLHINILKSSGYYMHMLEHCILPTECVSVLHMVLTINSDCFHKRHEPVGSCSGDVTCYELNVYIKLEEIRLLSPVWRRGRIPPPWPCES
jgi:hypothetical protein